MTSNLATLHRIGAEVAARKGGPTDSYLIRRAALALAGVVGPLDENAVAAYKALIVECSRVLSLDVVEAEPVRTSWAVLDLDEV